MKKSILLFLTGMFIFSCSYGQLDKGIWLVGGSGKFYSYNSENSSASNDIKSKYTQIDASPSIGYFVTDKLPFGVRFTVSSIKEHITSSGGLSTNIQRYWIGPFGRYYFLNKEKQYNILADVSYQFGFFGGGFAKGKLNTYSALVGPVIFFNTTAGIEFLLGYSYSKEDIEAANKNINQGFQIGFGFQIHLEKNE